MSGFLEWNIWEYCIQTIPLGSSKQHFNIYNYVGPDWDLIFVWSVPAWSYFGLKLYRSLFILCVWVFCWRVCLCTTCVPTSMAARTGYPIPFVSCVVGAGDWTWVFWKRRPYTFPLSHLSIPSILARSGKEPRITGFSEEAVAEERGQAGS